MIQRKALQLSDDLEQMAERVIRGKHLWEQKKLRQWYQHCDTLIAQWRKKSHLPEPEPESRAPRYYTVHRPTKIVEHRTPKGNVRSPYGGRYCKTDTYL